MGKTNPNPEEFFKLLTNEELLMIYYRFRDHKNTVLESKKKGFIHENVDTPFGPGVVNRPVPQEVVDAFMKGTYYTTVCSIVDKLGNYADIISDAQPELIKELENLQ